jgi:hypothetical protein
MQKGVPSDGIPAGKRITQKSIGSWEVNQPTLFTDIGRLNKETAATREMVRWGEKERVESAVCRWRARTKETD